MGGRGVRKMWLLLYAGFPKSGVPLGEPLGTIATIATWDHIIYIW